MSEYEYRQAWISLLKSERSPRKAVKEGIGDTGRKVLSALQCREMTTEDISKITGLSVPAAYSSVMRLYKQKRVLIDRVDGINIYRAVND